MVMIVDEIKAAINALNDEIFLASFKVVEVVEAGTEDVIVESSVCCAVVAVIIDVDNDDDEDDDDDNVNDEDGDAENDDDNSVDNNEDDDSDNKDDNDSDNDNEDDDDDIWVVLVVSLLLSPVVFSSVTVGVGIVWELDIISVSDEKKDVVVVITTTRLLLPKLIIKVSITEATASSSICFKWRLIVVANGLSTFCQTTVDSFSSDRFIISSSCLFTKSLLYGLDCGCIMSAHTDKTKLKIVNVTNSMYESKKTILLFFKKYWY